jgi:hypothetical protein
MVETFPKKGKKSSRPGTAAKDSSERLGSPYYYRCEKGGTDKRARELLENDYGKEAQETDKVRDGFPVSPRRTMIHG